MSSEEEDISDISEDIDISNVTDAVAYIHGAMDMDMSSLGSVNDLYDVNSEDMEFEGIDSNSSFENEVIYDDTSSSDENTSESHSESATNLELTVDRVTNMELTLSTAELQQPTTSGTQQSSASIIEQPSTFGLEITPKKNDIIESTINDSVNEKNQAFSCQICFESVNSSGLHRPACLKCGHIFGLNCIEKWIQSLGYGSRRCPTCNTKASFKDIRILYAKQLIAVDTSQLTALEIKLQQELREKTRVLAEIDKFKIKNEHLSAEVQKLTSIIESTKAGIPTTSGQTLVRQCLKKINLSKIPGCRVMAFNKNNLMLAVSQKSDSKLFTNSYMIRKLNASILEPTNDCIYAHSNQIRDMAFHPTEPNILATVSLDKKLKLLDMASNSVIDVMGVSEALWSVCWSGDNPNILVAGSQMGSLYFTDRRTLTILSTVFMEQMFPCMSLVPLPPSSSRSFINGGFIRTRMDNIAVFEALDATRHTIEHKITELPLSGLWSSCSYDNQSNILLSSSKPSGTNKSVRHIVSKMSDFNAQGGPTVYPIVTFYGGDKATQISRSCIVPSNAVGEDTLVCSYDEKSSNVNLSSVNKGCNIHNFHVKEKIFDLCPLNGVAMGGRRVVAGLSEHSLSIFSV